MSSKQKQLGIVIVVFLLLGGLMLLLKNSKNEVANYGFSEIHNNIKHPTQNGDSIYFFGGSFFAKYSLSDDSVARLSDYLLIDQDIDKLKWTDKNVLFHSTNSVKPYDDLSLSLSALQAPQAESYWWLYDFPAKTYQLLQIPGVSDCQDLFSYNQTSYICLPLSTNTQESKKITLLTPGAPPAELYSGESTIHDGKLIGNTFYFVAKSFDGKDTVSSLNPETKQVSSLFESKGSVLSYEADTVGNVLIIWKEKAKEFDENAEPHDNEDSKHNLVLAGKEKVLDSQGLTVSRLNTNRIGNDLFAVDSGGGVYQAVNGKIKKIINEDEAETHDVRYFAKNNEDFYYVTNQNELLTTKNVAESDLRKVSSFDVEADNIPDSGFNINAPDDNGETLVQLYNSDRPFAEQALTVDKILRDGFFEPSMFNFVWSLNSTSNEVPVAPRATVIK